MRINRPFSFVVKQVITVAVRRTVIGFIVFSALSGVTLAYQAAQPINTAYAAPPPDSCFTYERKMIVVDGAWVEQDEIWITGYSIDNAAGCPSDLELPGTINNLPVTIVGGTRKITIQQPDGSYTNVFHHALDGVTSLTIPSSVKRLAGLQHLNVTNLTIPNTVTSFGDCSKGQNDQNWQCHENGGGVLGGVVTSRQPFDLVFEAGSPITTFAWGAFYNSNLKSIVLPSSLTDIQSDAFYGNQLTSVTLPSSVGSIDPSAFSMQSPFGPAAEAELYSGDPARVKAVLDSVYYTRLTTDNPANPNNLQSVAYIQQDWSDFDNDGNTDEYVNFGGHLVNPASVTLNYTNANNTELQQSVTYVGQLLGSSTMLTNYVVSQGPDITQQQDLTAYYRVGQTVTFTAPAIDGYFTPEPATRTFVLGAATNSYDFVYTQPAIPGIARLSETGVSMWFIATAAVVALLTSSAFILRQLRS